MKLLVLLTLLFSVACPAEDIAKFTKVAHEYITKHSSVEKEKAWNKRWKERVKEDQMETGGKNRDENTFLDEVIFDWLAVHEREPDKFTKEDKIQVCRYYLLYREKKFTVPERLAGFLTDENLDKFLKDQL